MTGRLIAFEGADASGKSTQARRLARRLDVDLTFQFGATEIGGAIRAILLDPANAELDDRAEALLIIADKAQHVAEVVLPAMELVHTLITDRFSASALAYQGYGRGLDMDLLAVLLEFAGHGIEPDLTGLLEVELEVARARLGAAVDRLEGAGADFHRRLRHGYLEMAAADPDRWIVVDAGGSVEEVAADIDAAVDTWLASHP